MDLNQVLIEVSDFHRSVAFYTSLGLKLIVSQRVKYARLELPSGASTLSLYLSNQPAIGNSVLYFEVDDVDAKYHALRNLDVEFTSPPTDQSYCWRTAFFDDPNGNTLCIFHAGSDRRFPPWRIQEPQ